MYSTPTLEMHEPIWTSAGSQRSAPQATGRARTRSVSPSASASPEVWATHYSAGLAFLSASAYCDAQTSAIRDAAADIVRGARDDRDRAVRLFTWVRDEVKYTVGIQRHRASDTLRLRTGSCSTKANLLNAMLRASGIPSGFHLMRVRTREYFGPLCSDRFKAFVSHESFHVSACVFLGGRWLELDPTDDLALSQGTSHLSPQSRLVAFDGQDHARLHIDPAHLVSRSLSPCADIDRMLQKKRRAPRHALAVFNLYLDHCRANARRHDNARDVQDSFFQWLRVNRRPLHAAFVASEACLRMSHWLRQATPSQQAWTSHA